MKKYKHLHSAPFLLYFTQPNKYHSIVDQVLWANLRQAKEKGIYVLLISVAIPDKYMELGFLHVT